jgi:hypothetical protein
MLAFARRTLLWKYAAYFAGLVSLLLAISGIVGGNSASSVLEAEVNLTHIWDLIAQAHLKPGAVAFVVDSDGAPVASGHRPGACKDGPVIAATHSPRARAQPGGDGARG